MNRILIVEDEIAIVELIQAGLAKAGYAYEYALDGAVAAVDRAQGIRSDSAGHYASKAGWIRIDGIHRTAAHPRHFLLPPALPPAIR